MADPLRSRLNPPMSPTKKGCWHDGELSAVEDLMLDLATGNRFERLGVMAREHLATGGKRLRARLALATMQALGGDRAEAVPWAAAAELLHNATLVHDDVQDGDPVRRGQPTVWARHGVNQAINVGDLMLMLPIRCLEMLDAPGEVCWDLSRSLARCAEEVVRGQAAELDLLTRRQLDWEHYEAAVQGKTSALFSLPVYGSSRLAGLDEAQARALSEELNAIGLLFQIADDVLDLYGDKGREAPGADLREGKVSALVVEHLRLHPGDTRLLMRVLETPRDQTSAIEVRTMIERFRLGGALDAVWERMGAIEEQVHESLVLAKVPRLHAAAFDLVARALLPILHTDPLRTGCVAK